MSTITPHYRTVQQLLQSQSFSIDEYQREYKWKKENIEELLDDFQGKFENSYKPGDGTTKVSSYEEYFLGSIIVSKRNGKNYLIDGQQRVTSLTLLLICLYRAAQDKQLPVIQTIAPLIFSDNLGEPKFNLDIPDRIPLLEALFKGEDFNPDGKDESIQTMYARYTEIVTSDLISDLNESLPHFIYWLLTKVGLIEIAADNDNDAYAIFETMNDRGMPLSPVDMLKAYMLAPIEDAEKRNHANQEWRKQVFELISWGGEHKLDRDENCIKAWLRAQYADSIRERKAKSTDKDWELIGTVFHRWVRDNSQKLKLGKQSENYVMITDNFPFYGGAYRKILNASNIYTKDLEAVFYNSQNDFTWQNTVLLAPLAKTDNEETILRKIAVTSTYLDIWIMRRVINYIRVGYSSASYAMYLLCTDIRRKSLPELVDILFSKLQDDDVTFKGSPSRGRYGIKSLYLNQFTRRYIYHLLARLTAFTEKESGRSDNFPSLVDKKSNNPYDIEHIWEDNYSKFTNIFPSAHEFQDWRNHVASLLLLPADVNRSLKDKPYTEKVKIYAKQNFFAASLSPGIENHQPKFNQFRFRYNLPFKSYDFFTKDEQLERRELIAALVEIIWSPERLREHL